LQQAVADEDYEQAGKVHKLCLQFHSHEYPWSWPLLLQINYSNRSMNLICKLPANARIFSLVL
jgi:hypothetical protein